MTEALLSYDEDRLLEVLQSLDPKARVLFAAVCAERLMPAYERFHERNQLGDPAALRGALTSPWSVEGCRPAELQDARDVIESLLDRLPSDNAEGVSVENAGRVIEWATMINATASAIHTVDCALTGASQAAAWASYQPYEALDRFVGAALDIDFNVPGSEEQVLSHPSIQAELHRQRRDLRALQSVLPSDLSALVPSMRHQAREEGTDLLKHMERGV